jgi:hypothetical protein
MTTETLARLLIGAAVVLGLAGLVVLLLSRVGVTRLPGDLVWRRDGLTIYAPIGLLVLLSILLTILVNLFLRR